MATRTEVYKAIDTERNYQDGTWSNSSLEVGEELTLLRVYLGAAESQWAARQGDEQALEGIRKIAAIAVRCLENHGVTPRQ